MDIQLSELGRLKSKKLLKNVSDEISSDEVAAIIAHEAAPYFMSSDVGAVWNPNTKTGFVVVGGFRKVGTAKIVDKKRHQL